MILYRLKSRLFVENDGKYYGVGESSLDALLARTDLLQYLNALVGKGESVEDSIDLSSMEAPIEHQEVWASGVTY